jgi:hypothetical protein
MSNILIVCQDELVRNSLREAAAARGHSVVVAADSRQALALESAPRFCLTVVDLASPGVSGWKLLVELKRRGMLTETVVVGIAPSWDRPSWADDRLDRLVNSWIEGAASAPSALDRCLCHRNAVSVGGRAQSIDLP